MVTELYKVAEMVKGCGIYWRSQSQVDGGNDEARSAVCNAKFDEQIPILLTRRSHLGSGGNSWIKMQRACQAEF